MTDVTRNFRIPVSLDAEIEEQQPKLNITERYIFFVSLGLKLFIHRHFFERNPKLIEKIISQQKEYLVKMKICVMTDEFFKNMDDKWLDSVKFLIESEQESRTGKERNRNLSENRNNIT